MADRAELQKMAFAAFSRDLPALLDEQPGKWVAYHGAERLGIADADADGYHISTLLLAFFFRHMTELIRKGHVYIAQPPLYRIDVGKEKFWARDDAHREEIIDGLRANAKYEIQRFKGLGEMNAGELKETTLDPRHRTLLKVQIDSNLDADRTFVDLLGKDPAQRYRFVMDKAALVEVEELDV